MQLLAVSFFFFRHWFSSHSERTLPAPAGPITMTPNLLILGWREGRVYVLKWATVRCVVVSVGRRRSFCLGNFWPGLPVANDPAAHRGKLSYLIVRAPLRLLDLYGVGHPSSELVPSEDLFKDRSFFFFSTAPVFEFDPKDCLCTCVV